MASPRKHITLSAGTANTYERHAEKLGLTTRSGGGRERPNIAALLTLLARSIEDGTIDLGEYRVTPMRLTPIGESDTK